MDAPAGVTQEEDHTGFLHLSSAVQVFFSSRKSETFLKMVVAYTHVFVSVFLKQEEK